MKTALAVIVLSLLPGLAAAACYGDHASQQTMTCAEGAQFDENTGTCVPTVTS